MRIVTLSKIKNEADMIESFVRYHGEIVDEMFFVENGSTDGTLEILYALREEGYSLTIFDEREAVFDELKFINKYAGIILREDEVDWLVPIDADEFLYADGRNPREELELWNPDVVYMANWRTYLCDKNARERGGFVPDRFEVYREERCKEFTKVILPGRLWLKQKMMISRGNHQIVGIDVQTERTETIMFAHYPIRSGEQFKMQVAVNNIMQRSRWNRLEDEAWHWDEMYHKIKNQDIDLEQISRTYSIPQSVAAGEIGTYKGKLDYGFLGDIRLKYEGQAKSSAFYNLMCAAEKLAERLAVRQQSQSREAQPKKRLILYGIGRIARGYAAAVNQEKYEIIAYVDSNTANVGTIFCNKAVQGIEILRRETYDYVVITSNVYYHEIRDNLLELGISDGKIRFLTEILQEGWGETYHCL